jgi:hypothetical protein
MTRKYLLRELFQTFDYRASKYFDNNQFELMESVKSEEYSYLVNQLLSSYLYHIVNAELIQKINLELRNVYDEFMFRNNGYLLRLASNGLFPKYKVEFEQDSFNGGIIKGN